MNKLAGLQCRPPKATAVVAERGCPIAKLSPVARPYCRKYHLVGKTNRVGAGPTRLRCRVSQSMLIINADALGRSKAETDAVILCHANGRITSTSAMVFMTDSERASEALQARGST